jgi:glycosyltransferase involved in cell wall biosynthesis
VKVVTEWSGAEPSMFSSVKEKLFLAWVLHANKISARKSDILLAPCEFVKEWIARAYQLKAHVMYVDGVNFDIFDKDRIHEHDFFATHPQLRGKKIILFVGRITESKKIYLLIDAFTILKKWIPNVVLLLVGNYSSYLYYYNRLFEKIRLENLSNDVIFAGIASWEDLPKYFAACSVYATCSAWEGFLRAEVFAFCKPIICFDTGANIETVRNGYSGFVVDNQNINAFADKLRIILANEDLSKEYGENGYRWCEQVLDIDVISKHFVDFFIQLVSK